MGNTLFNESLYKLEVWYAAIGNIVRHSIVASIPACHAGDQGSIPCDGVTFVPRWKIANDIFSFVLFKQFVHGLQINNAACVAGMM